jgi:ABC-type branched-subunit amino acid transport system permease subunit
VISLLNVAGVVAALEIGRQIFAAHDGNPGYRPPVWPWGAAVLLGIVIAQAALQRWNYVPLVVVLLVTAVLEFLRRMCMADGGNLADYRLVLYALMLILMMILRPEGLFGVNEVWDYLGLRNKKLAKRVRRSQKGAAA